MYDLLKDFIKPELLVLVPVLYLVGAGLKKSEIKDKLIPLMLGVSGVLLAAMYIGATSTFNGAQDVVYGAFAAFTQGVLCAGASVYVNQIVKQATKNE